MAIAGTGLWIGLGGGSSGADDEGARATPTRVNTAAVARRDLVEREDVDGTLGYAGSRAVTNQREGTLTRVRAEGAVVDRGEWLYEVDGKPTAWLMYGIRPAWRAFESDMADGEDVRQLERNLQALGYDPYGAMSIDEDFTAATTAAIKRFRAARGEKQDGTLALGEVVFLPGSARIKSRKASAGMALRPGQEVLETSSSRRVVTVQLTASRQSLVSRGDSVEVELPDGRTVKGRISRVSKVARPGEEGDEATVEVTIALRSRSAARGLDQAPVTVGITQEARRDALSVPVTALLALEGGGSGVEVVGADGRRRTVRVKTGLFADGYVEVSAGALREGMRVVIPDEL
ncbi:MAG TPA: HlyD family efflux transporter periplasmic adaptor subunit [Solirubrobacteraceae bacterium]|nr:HlyD family efflux transporter periplasmic adaptor subunit [Solirubrobacteraceae bacterium]